MMVYNPDEIEKDFTEEEIIDIMEKGVRENE